MLNAFYSSLTHSPNNMPIREVLDYDVHFTDEKTPTKPLKAQRGTGVHPAAELGCDPRAHLSHHSLYRGVPVLERQRRGWGKTPKAGESGQHSPSLFSPEPWVKSSWYCRFGKLAGKNLFMKGLEGKTKQVGKQSPHGQQSLTPSPGICLQAVISQQPHSCPER